MLSCVRAFLHSSRAAVHVLAALLWLPAAAGCKFLHLQGSTEEIEVQSIRGQENTPLTLTVLQAEVMRFADEYVATVAQAADEFRDRMGTSEAGLASLSWKLGQANLAFVDAAGPSPVVNLMDIVTLAALSRVVQEDQWVGKQFGETARPLLEAHLKLEGEAWAMARKFLRPEQEGELLDLIQEWRTRNPLQTILAQSPFRHFAEALAKVRGERAPGSHFSLLVIDPLAGLDPTTRTIEQTRFFAERAMYYFQRMPNLMSWQTELLTYKITTAPEVKQALAHTERLTQSVEFITRTVETLPKVISEERQAALRQLFDAVAAERKTILEDMASEDNRLRSTLVELRETLDSGKEMFATLNTAIKSLDAFVASFDKGPQPSPPSNSRPFDIVEYGSTAAEINAGARELNELLGSLDKSLPKMKVLVEETSTQVERRVVQLFWISLAIIVVFLAGSVLAVLAYFSLARRRPGGRHFEGKA